MIRYSVYPGPNDLDDQFLSVTMTSNSDTLYTFSVNILPNHHEESRTGKITIWLESENAASDTVTVSIIQAEEQKSFDPTYDGMDNDMQDVINEPDE